MKKLVELTATVVATGTLGFAGLALSTGIAGAVVGGAAPQYHWCPGDYFDPGWGNNWEPGGCHDDFHRDGDGGDHSRDYRPYGDRGDFRDGEFRDGAPYWGPPGYYGAPDYAPPGNYWGPPGYDEPPPPPVVPVFCIPFVDCPPN